MAVESRDLYGRLLHDLRISVLDRCNFRCTYCMPEESLKNNGAFLANQQLLSDDEIERLVVAFTGLGVSKIRLTGGEPLLRPGLSGLVARLAAIPGIEDLALTTNGILLPRQAADLAAAGLNRVTVSIDSLDEQVFLEMTGGKGSVRQVLAGITAAEEAGLKDIKINTVAQKGVNDHTIMDLLEHFRGTGHIVRLIEFMDVGTTNHWSREQVVPGAEWLKRIHDRWPLRPVAGNYAAETARRYAYEDGQGEIGLINSITEPFCGACTRARLTADGIFYTCLFAAHGTDLRSLVRSDANTETLQQRISGIWETRTDRYSEHRNGDYSVESKVEMYRLGG
jgi:cyclic pyranopterin phosphate synthase